MTDRTPASPLLAACANFRDLGSLPAADGRRVRRGLVFRSGTLAFLGEAEHAVLMPLGVKTICDLRHIAERESEPTRWCDDAAEILSWDYRSPLSRAMKELMHADASPADAAAGMEIFYAALPNALAAPIRAVFAAVADGRTPLVFHCSAGKDRTGIVAGLLLDAVGVERAAILADYALSAELMDYEGILQRHPATSLGLSRDGFSLGELPPAIRAPILASAPRYLAATFAMAEAESGSVEAYLVDKIGVDAGLIARAKAALLD